MKTDNYGDPLPEGAVLRLGTTRFREGDRISTLVYAPEGKRIASGGDEQVARVWDAETGKELQRLPAKRFICSVAFSPDGEQLAVASKGVGNRGAESLIQVWELRAERETARLMVRENGSVSSVAWSPDGHSLASSELEGKIRLWDLRSGKELFQRLVGHEDGRHTHKVAFAADGKSIIASGNDVKRWSFPAGTELKGISHKNAIRSMALFPDSRTVVFSDSPKTSTTPHVLLGDLQTGKKQELSTEEVDFVTVSPEGRLVGGGGWHGRLFLWNAGTQSLARSTKAEPGFVHVRALAFSPDGKKLVSGGDDNTLRCWDVETLAEVHSCRAHRNAVASVCFRSQKQELLSASWDGTIRFWDLKSGTEQHVYGCGNAWAHSVACRLDNKMFAWAASDHVIHCCDLKTHEERFACKGHADFVTTLAYTEKHLVSRDDKTIRVWDAMTGQLVHRFDAESRFSTIGISADGTYVVAGDSQTVRVWNLANASEVKSLIGHEDDVRAAAISADGKYVQTS